MLIDEILSKAKESSRAEQLRLVDAIQEQWCAEPQMTAEQKELLANLRNASEIPIWSPFDSFEAAAELYRLGEELRKNQ